MKRTIIPVVVGLLMFTACGGDDSSSSDDELSGTEYRERMRQFVINIAEHARKSDDSFIIIPQNGQELVSSEESGSVFLDEYMDAIDGTGREDLYFGYDDDNVATPADESQYLEELLDLAQEEGIVHLVTDYCWTSSYVDQSYQKNSDKGYISFAASSRDLNEIPGYPASPYNVNSDDVTKLNQGKNFLYLIDPGKYSSAVDFITALSETNYDILIIDAFFENTILTSDQISALKTKTNGGSRLVISYMSIGEAEDYRYYWESDWRVGSPSWIKTENPDWEGNYKVAYWESGWQDVIFGSDSAYLDKIIAAGFDGVYLDIIDAFEYFE